MGGELSTLRELIEAAFDDVDGDAPEARLARLETEVETCFARLFASYDRRSVPWNELGALAAEFRDRSRRVPDSASRAHFDWWRRTTGAYKAVVGADGRLRAPDLPQGVVSVPLALVPRVYASIQELAYALHRREEPAECDCGALLASGIRRRPSSSELRALGETNDGYYRGTTFECGSCEMRWFCGEMDDDSNAVFWEPHAASATG